MTSLPNPQPDTGSTREREIAAEQNVINLAYSELDRQLAEARTALAKTESTGASGTHQSRGERDAYAAHYSDLIFSLEAVEDRLVFGRMDFAPDSVEALSPSPVTDGGKRHYVGRTGIQDAHHHEVVLDWRAPLARAFYQATASKPMGLIRRRHIATRNRQVIGLEDEVIDVDSLQSSATNSTTLATESLQGEGALIAAMSAARDGRMGDIVATIQAEQDRIVTSDGKGVLVVQGGPGTGKTAVALHRVAYLFYCERARLERSGVLLVGPSRTFLRYVEQVLPSLGETGVVATTISDLVPGIHARASESTQVAELKGRLIWAKILRRAVRNLQRLPDAPREIIVQGTRLSLETLDVREAMSRARRSGKPHNLARETFVLWLLERLTDQYAQATHQDASDPQTRAWIREDIRTAKDSRREINLCWMPTTPVALLEKLWSRPELLQRLAPELKQNERKLLVRAPGSALTPADVPLIDELAELLGPSEDADAYHARLQARRRAELVAYAEQAITSQNLGAGMVNAQMLAERMEDTGSALTLAERARGDRSWTYGHIVVDEAQELGAMAWRSLARRCPVKSFTIVGDLAQYSGKHAPISWRHALAGLGVAADAKPQRSHPSTPLREEVLTVCYRTPASIMEAAHNVATALGCPPTYPIKSVRDLKDCLQWHSYAHEPQSATDQTWAQEVRRVVGEEIAYLDAQVGVGVGRLAVITAQAQVVTAWLEADATLAAAMQAPGGDLLRARVAVMSPQLAKGLEFDTVVLLDAALIGQHSPGDLYVAMTRPTRRLRMISRAENPAGLA